MRSTNEYLSDRFGDRKVFSKVNRLATELGNDGAVGDEEHGLVGTGGKEAGEEFALGGLVEGGADFVEQEDAARTQQATGNGDTLSLTLAESAAALTQFGIKTMRQVEHEIGTGRM